MENISTNSNDVVAAAPAAADTLPYASLLRRLGAYLIDSILLGVVTGILNAAILSAANDPENGAITGLAVLINTVIVWGYFTAFESSRHQATPGKMALGLIVTNLEGQRIKVRHALLRAMAKGLIGFLAIIIPFTKRKQAVHDMIARTLVLKKS